MLCCAAQVVDDILDFTQSSEALGKPQGQDLASGNLTAPVLFALQVRLTGLGQWEQSGQGMAGRLSGRGAWRSRAGRGSVGRWGQHASG